MTLSRAQDARGDPACIDMPAARFWERGRIFYNLALIAVAAFWFYVGPTRPHWRVGLTFSSAGKILVLVVLANILYGAAYVADLAIRPAPRSSRQGIRWALWAAGTILAIVVASYWINDEIYPDLAHATSLIRSLMPC